MSSVSPPTEGASGARPIRSTRWRQLAQDYRVLLAARRAYEAARAERLRASRQRVAQ